MFLWLDWNHWNVFPVNPRNLSLSFTLSKVSGLWFYYFSLDTLFNLKKSVDGIQRKNKNTTAKCISIYQHKSPFDFDIFYYFWLSTIEPHVQYQISNSLPQNHNIQCPANFYFQLWTNWKKMLTSKLPWFLSVLQMDFSFTGSTYFVANL